MRNSSLEYFEIAAEDYLQLLGSPTGKRVTRYLDISQKMGNTVYQPANSANRMNFNAIPQRIGTSPGSTGGRAV